MNNDKPILCLDFDGVLHAYTSGWKGINVVSDGPTPGAMGFLSVAVEHFNVCVLSSRSQYSTGLTAMRLALHDWLIDAFGLSEGTFILGKIEFPIEKPAAFLTIDDRALCFNGTFPDAESLLSFKPWHQK